MILIAGGLGRYFNNEGGTLLKAINTYNRGFRDIPGPFHPVQTREKSATKKSALT